MKKIAILGSTGSIGKNVLEVVRHTKNKFQVIALAAHSNIDLLEQQAHEFHPKVIAVYNKEKALILQKRLPKCAVLAGTEGLIDAASIDDASLIIAAISGTMGISPTIAAIQAGKNVALANKEVLVSGGSYVMSLVRKKGIQLIPIDSEHSAIFQCLQGEKKQTVSRIILTASGGPFRLLENLEKITVEDALRHPNWNMGPKVTIDSSTLMNKGLEVIETHWLFDIPLKKIEVLIHPQSIIHSMVEFIDHSILAQMGDPTMITPIQYAMTYPERFHSCIKPFDFLKNHTLQFLLPDTEKFRCLSLAYSAIEKGGSLPCFMNAANEILVKRFLNREIRWDQIGVNLEKLMSRHSIIPTNSLDDILAIDKLAREEAERV
jgi:1-deoxy-D-xylulose-5-phosphate reductoisomerase